MSLSSRFVLLGQFMSRATELITNDRVKLIIKRVAVRMKFIALTMALLGFRLKNEEKRIKRKRWKR